MKTVILSLFMSLMSLVSFSQAYQVTVSGTVTDGPSGDPLPGYAVTIETDSTANGGAYYNMVITDMNGYYTDTFDAADGESGIVSTSVTDCDGTIQKVDNNYDVNNNTFQVDFAVCNNPGGGGGTGDSSCMAMFSYYFEDNFLEAHFEDMSFGNPDSWSWEFGDGDTSSEQNPVHLYAQAGEYEVTLTISGDSCSSSFTDWVWVSDDSTGFEQCQAMYWAFPSENDFMTYVFEDQSWTSSGYIPDSWAWDFGDGATSNEQNPTHTYTEAGEYEVCLTITDTASDCESTYCGYIFVEDMNGCQAYYYYMPEDSMGFDMTTLHFFDYSAGNPDSWSWDFGDGETSTEQNPVHTFADGGIYNVCLTIYNSADTCEDTYCEDVYVFSDSTGNCFGYFIYEQTDTSGLTFDFEAINYSNQTMDYSWDFGDGTTGTGENISHTYATAGTYDVVLNATSSDTTEPCSWSIGSLVWAGNNLTFTFSGNVYVGEDSLNPTFADAGSVYLMVFDTTGSNLVNIDTTTIDTNGFYEFEADPFEHCVYFVQAELSDQSVYFGQYVPTYCISTTNWEEAFPIFPFCPIMSYDIFMVPQGTTSNGDGSVDGLVTTQGSREAAQGVLMLLMNEDGTPVKYIRTSENGTFDFSDLAYGTYLLRAELVGIQSETATITLTQDNPTANVSVTLKNGEALLGMNELSSAYLKEVSNIYPNPVVSNASMNITMKQASKVTITVTNQIGQVVISNVENLNSGMNRINLRTSKLPQGVYIIKVLTTDDALTTGKMIKVH